MREIDSLAIEITSDSITVTKPQTGQQVTYRKDPESPVLIAKDVLRGKLDASRTTFLAQAWKAAYATAYRIGWLRS
jgi:hypothetical protein